MPYNPKSKENLVGFDKMSVERRTAIAKAGNKAGLEVRLQRKKMREALEEMLQLKREGGKLTYQEEAIIGLIEGAAEGKAENFKVILETLGELKTEESKTTPDVQINIIDNSNLEKTLYEEEE